MNKEKRFLISGIVLAICIIATTTFFLLRTGYRDKINPLKIIPGDAALILQINEFNVPLFLTKNNTQIWNDLKSLPAIINLNNQLIFIDSLLKQYPKFYKPSPDDKIYISGHISAGSKMSVLCIVPLPSGTGENDLERLLKLFEGYKNFRFTERKFESRSVFSLSSPDGQSYHFSCFSGNLLYSGSPTLVEEAITQTSMSISLANDAGLKSVLNSIGKNKAANVFIDLKQAGKIFSVVANESVDPDYKNNTSFGNWIELDLTGKDDFLMLNGFSYISDTTQSFIRAITKENPVPTEAVKVLPASVACFVSFGISDPQKCYNNYLDYLKQTGKADTYLANLKNLNNKYDINFSEFFLSLVSNELVLAYNRSPEKIVDNSYYIVLKCKSRTESEKAIQNLAKKLEEKTNSNLSFTYSPDNEIKYKIFKFPIYPLFGRLLGEFFNKFEENYISVVDNYIVIAGSQAGISHFIKSYMLQKTLYNDEIYRNYRSNLAVGSYLECYINLSNSQPFFSNYLNNTIISNWNKNLSVFEKTQSFGFQISEVSSNPYFNLFLKHSNDFRGQPQTVWESLLDTSAHFKPKFLQNHYTKQNEIFIQDDKNTVYLLNQAGRILWKVPLNEPINSDIYQIDYFNNGKLQILFSTENHIHLLDRNGNYTERYPVRLRAGSTSGLSLFDYDADKNYRILIPCDDKQVYAYSKEGTLISGWNFKGSDHFVTQPLSHFRAGEKDFIIFGDENYTYILDRKGEERIKLSETFSKSPGNTYYFNQTGNIENSNFITTDTSGTIIKIALNGKVEKQKIKRFSSKHFFDLKDVNGDGSNDYIFLDNNILSVYKSNSELIFEKKFENDISQRPVYYHFSYSDRKIGLVSDAKSTIYLLNNNGALYKGFPLEGTTLFTIGYFDPTSSRFNLIVGGRNNFLYNYAVE
jgi:hypothetical protein